MRKLLPRAYHKCDHCGRMNSIRCYLGYYIHSCLGMDYYGYRDDNTGMMTIICDNCMKHPRKISERFSFLKYF